MRTAIISLFASLAFAASVGAAEDLCAQRSPEEMAKAAGVTLPKGPWHVVNIWWDFEKPVEHFTSLEMDVTIDRDVPSDYNLYVAPCGVAHINGMQFYGGLQTNINGWPNKQSRERVFPGRGAIFSRWSSDKKAPIGLDHVRAAGSDCVVESAGYEGEFASVRRPFAWTKGTYTYSITKGDSETAAGKECTWFHCRVKDSAGAVREVGSLRFEGTDFTFWGKHSAFVEIYSTAKIPHSGIPKVNITFGWPRLNGEKIALKKASAYYPDPTGGVTGSPDCAWVKAEGENCAVEIGPIFKRDEALRRHPLPIHAASAKVLEDAGARMHAIFDREWEYAMKESPTWASSLGDRRWNDQWGDVGPAAVQRRNEHDCSVLEEFKGISRAALTPADQLNFDLFKRELESSLEGARFRLHLMPITIRDGIQLSDDLADALRFETVKDYEDWIGRLRRFPTYMSQTIALMREGMAARIVQPKVVMQRVPAQIARQITDKPDDSPFFKPFTKFPADIAASEQERLKREARAAIETSIEPAFSDFQKFFTAEYLPACFDDVGAWQMPQGHDCYAYLTRRFTTTTLTPRQIHELGLAEVRRIKSEMEKIKSDAGFKGTLPEFFHFLKTDPSFFYRSSADLLGGYEAVSARIKPTLPLLFKTQPSVGFKVQAIPASAAPDTSTGYYRPPADDGSREGTFFVNLYKPETRPKWEMMALSLHESVPGHHLQIALAQEQAALPTFRRHLEFTAYVEGWALYCESLGDELGLYTDPYDKFGQLTYEMWRAVRLVIDTGIHELKWSREKAIAYFRENAPKSELDITNEVDRYIGWPGQALAYKIGQMRIRELRTRAEKELGPRFNLKDFHDVVLLGGSMPLEVLEDRVDQFIQSNRSK